jgi:hypothetical protein
MPRDHPEEVERRLAQRRAATAEQVAELRSRATLGYVSGKAMRTAMPALTGLAPAAGRTASRNPISSALISAGLTWMLFGPEPDLRQVAGNAVSGAGNAVSKTGASVKQSAVGALDAIGDVAGRVADGGRSVAGKVREAGKLVGSSARRTLAESERIDSSLMAAVVFGGAIALGLLALQRKTGRPDDP